MNKKLFLLTWLAGLPGIVAVALYVFPMLVEGQTLPAPMWVLNLASALQSALLLALAAFAGARLAPIVGLRTPVLSALAESRSIGNALQPQLVPAMIGGLAGGLILYLFAQFAPDGLARIQEQASIPLVARLLYGGVTEEILIRWGLMTTLAWLAWRFLQRSGTPSAAVIWFAIPVSALIFGIAHLPAASALVAQMTAAITLYIVAANAAFGIVAGFLYWRYGLESAIGAHMLAHLLFWLASL